MKLFKRILKIVLCLLLAAVIRDGKTFLPDGKTVLASGDKVVVVTAGRNIMNMDDILA